MADALLRIAVYTARPGDGPGMGGPDSPETPDKEPEKSRQKKLLTTQT
jgi:hypothetical protein